MLRLLLPRPKHPRHLGVVALEDHLRLAEVAPVPHVELQIELWPGRVVLGGVTVPCLSTPQHVAVRIDLLLPQLLYNVLTSPVETLH